MFKKIRTSKNKEGIEAIISFVIGVLGVNIAILLGMENEAAGLIVDDGPGAAMFASVMLIGLSIYNFKQWVEK